MKKLAAIFLTLLFASSASAQVITNPTTNARMDALGVQNWQIEDDFNIWINPAQINNYKNGAYVELGTDPCALGGNCGNAVTTQPPFAPSGGTGHNERGVGAFGGLHVDVPYGTWGVYVGRPYSGPLNSLSTNNAGTAPTANRFDLIYGLHGAPLGFYLSYADNSEKKTAAPGTAKDESSEINVGAGGIFGGGMLEAAVDLGLPNAKCKDQVGNNICGTAGANDNKDDAGLNWALLARHHAGMGNSKLLTTARVISSDQSFKTGTVKTDDTTLAWSLDTALNSKPNADTLFVAGIGISSSSREVKPSGGTKETLDNLQIPLNLAVENQTFKRVQTRLGISKPLYNKTTDKNFTAAATKDETVADGAAVVSAGLGVAVTDNLMIDAVINQDVLFTGTYMISGIPESLNSKLSATYRFK